MNDEDYPNTPPHVLEKIRKIVPSLPGWLTPERGCELADAIFESRPRICVELGVFGGRSLVAQAIALKAAGYGGVVAGIDPWRVEDALEGENEDNKAWWAKQDLNTIHNNVVNVVYGLELQAQAVVVRSASQHAAPLFGEIDMLFVDANHSEVASMRDVETWVPKVKKGGYVFADDANWPSTQAAYKRLQEMAYLTKIGSETIDGVETHGRYLVCRKK